MKNKEIITIQEYRDNLAQKLKSLRLKGDDGKKLAEVLLADVRESEQYKESKTAHHLHKKQQRQNLENTKQVTKSNEKKNAITCKETKKANQKKYPYAKVLGIVTNDESPFSGKSIVVKGEPSKEYKLLRAIFGEKFQHDDYFEDNNAMSALLQVGVDNASTGKEVTFYCDFPGKKISEITLEEATKYVEKKHNQHQVDKLIEGYTKSKGRPIQLGLKNNIPVLLMTGSFGPYIKCGNATLSYNEIDVDMMNLVSRSRSSREETKRKIGRAFRTVFPQGAWDCDKFINVPKEFKNHYICIKSTDKGYWLHLTDKYKKGLKKTVRYKIPKEYQSIEQVKMLSLEDCLTIIEKKRKKRQPKKER